MKQEALKYFADIDLTLLALILFFASFGFMIFRVYFYDKKEKYDNLSQIPLQEEGSHHG